MEAFSSLITRLAMIPIHDDSCRCKECFKTLTRVSSKKKARELSSFTAFTAPLVRRTSAPLLATSLVSIQPMPYGASSVFCFGTELETYRDWETDRKSTRLNSSHLKLSRMPSSA